MLLSLFLGDDTTVTPTSNGRRRKKNELTETIRMCRSEYVVRERKCELGSRQASWKTVSEIDSDVLIDEHGLF